jgi:L-threonylcarbamoyladenylate synthase
MYILKTTNIDDVAQFIVQGRVVAFPTGTAYGLAVDALQGHAIQRLRNLKQRPQEKTFTIFLDQSLWDEYLDITNEEKNLLTRYANTALTVLVKPKESLMHLAQDGVIGLRVIDHLMMRDLAERAQVPLTFPGRIGTTYDLSLAAILDGGDLRQGTQSTIVKIKNGNLEIVRQGSLMLDAGIVG